MFKKLSLRWRLTILCASLLSICCIGLTIVLNFSAFQLADRVESAVITTPAIEMTQIPIEEALTTDEIPSMPAIELQDAKRGFRVQSVLYMLLIIFGGSGLIYYISGKALKPLDGLNNQIKNITVQNLSNTIPVPPTKDEIAELTQSFNDMTDQLNEAFMIQKRFSASAAHELRTPLAVLQTKLDVFKKKATHSMDEYKDLLFVFEKQITRLRILVKNLLDMTNMEEDNETGNFYVQDVFEDIIEELSPIALDKHVSLRLNCDHCSVSGNADLLYRAFYNLVENGIKYNKDGGFVQIDVCKINHNQVDIEIKDNGIGIDNEMKNHIFEPFYRVDKSRSRELGGVGLGLSIVENIIKKHNGTISVLDNDDGGTCFKIRL